MLQVLEWGPVCLRMTVKHITKCCIADWFSFISKYSPTLCSLQFVLSSTCVCTCRGTVSPGLKPNRREDVALLQIWLEDMMEQVSKGLEGMMQQVSRERASGWWARAGGGAGKGGAGHVEWLQECCEWHIWLLTQQL